MNENYCNNCGKTGHIYYECKCPIISNGIIAFRKSKSKNDYEYLMICRRNTLGLIDFMRGNYSVHNKEYILSMFKQMTITEKQNIMTKSFNKNELSNLLKIGIKCDVKSLLPKEYPPHIIFIADKTPE